jgi:alpha/beta superfamily hydrolase
MKKKKEWIRADAIASVENILKKKDYKRIIIVCKSIGTIAGIEILMAIDRLNHAEIIWLTPLCQNEEIVNSLHTITNRSLIVIGTDDSCFVERNVEKLQKKANYDVIEIPEADHSLEIKGDTIKSVQLMKDILKKVQEFIDTSR